MVYVYIFFFKRKTAYEMRISDWSSDVCSSDLVENGRAALLLVARGEAPLGVVYGSDALAEPRVKVLATFPESSHPPIVYPVAKAIGRASRRERVCQSV